MAVGQAVLTRTLDVGALNVVEARLEVSAVAECAAHGALLREVLELHRVLSAAGAGLSTTAQLALLRQSSEQTAQSLLAKAELLGSLPGGLEALDCGLLTVEQTSVLTRLLAPHDEPVRLRVWQRLQARLTAASDGGAVLPPARFAALLREWILTADPRDAIQRRRAAEDAGDVDYRKRDDGLVDLFANGLTGPVAQAVLQRIRSRAAHFGSLDDRPAGKRRLDAMVDLLLGRDRLPLDTDTDTDAHCGPSCGCRLGSPVPCGTDVAVLMPLGAALRTTDELATLTGHGPLEPDLTEQLLLSVPRIRPVWVDDDGVPVATGARVTVPPRGDPAALRELLLQLAATPPPEQLPRHPDDHAARPGRTCGACCPPEPRRARTAHATSYFHETGGRPPSTAASPAPGRHARRLPDPRRLATAADRPCAAVRVARLRCRRRRVRPRPRPGLAGRPDLRVQQRTAVPTPPPPEAAADEQGPPTRQRRRLDRPDRPALDQPQPAHPAEPAPTRAPRAARRRPAHPQPAHPQPARTRRAARPRRQRPRPVRAPAHRLRPAPARERPPGSTTRHRRRLGTRPRRPLPLGRLSRQDPPATQRE